MRGSVLASLGFCVLAPLSTISTGQATIPPSCKTPVQCDPAKFNPFCIDARTGPPAMAAEYGHKQVVRVFLVNRNPFLYDYTVKTQTKDFSTEDGDALSTFSSLTGVGSSPKTSGQSTTAGQTSGTQKTQSFYEQFLNSEKAIGLDQSTGHGNATSACTQTLNNIDETMSAADDKLKSTEDLIAALARRMQGSVLKVSSADLKNAGSSGDDLCLRAVNLRNTLNSVVEGQIASDQVVVTPLADDFDVAANALTTLNAAIADYKTGVAKTLNCDPDNCEGKYQAAFKDITGCKSDADLTHALAERRQHDIHLKNIEQNVSELTKKMQSLKDARCQLDASRTQLDKVLDDDTSFFQRIGPFGPFSDSEDVTLAISRSLKKELPTNCGSDTSTQNKPSNPSNSNQNAKPPNAGQKTTPSPNNAVDSGASVADVTLHFGGGQRFFAAAGPVVSFLPVYEFQRATGVTTSGTAATIIDYKTNSQSRIDPVMVFGHWRPLDANWFLLSVGATAKSDNQKTSAEFLFGPTFGFIGNRVFFTAGGYLGQQQKLAGNLQVGATIPSSLTGEIPVQSSYHWNVGLSINFRLAGGGGGSSKTATNAGIPKKSTGP